MIVEYKMTNDQKGIKIFMIANKSKIITVYKY